MFNNVPDLVQAITRLLEANDEIAWATTLRNIMIDFDIDPSATKANIRRLYGGMGSLNDVVLQDRAGPKQAENDELDRLRSELFSICQK
jgi:hypothetical protein